MRAEKDHNVRRPQHRDPRDRPEASPAMGYLARNHADQTATTSSTSSKGKLDVEALTEINLKVGESTIKMTPYSIDDLLADDHDQEHRPDRGAQRRVVIVKGAIVTIN